jgi:release factor glutamine methyltransferase
VDLHAGGLALVPDRSITPDELERINAFLARRIDAREPVSCILGRREFWSLEFRITPDVLDPRPDSETLVETALGLFPVQDRPLRVLDLGTGSGCLLLAVLHGRPRASGIGVDASEAALAVARQNAAQLGLADRAEFRRGDWGAGLDEAFDLVLCNPPYIAESERGRLPPEVLHHDPPAALFGGADGLDAYRIILPALRRLLAPGSCALFEIGAGQAERVSAIARASGLAVCAIRRDLAGRDRCVVLRAA